MVVIKKIQMSTMEAARWIAALSVISAFIWSVGGFLALVICNTYRDEMIRTAGLASSEDVRRLERTLADAADNFASLSRQMVILSRPEDVVNYRESPSAVNGACVAGEACAVAVFAERSQRAAECQIIGNRTELLILTNGREYVARPVPNRRATNLRPAPRALEPVFMLPSGVPEGPSRSIIRSYYTGCFWQTDGEPPVIQDSPIFDLTIIQEAAQ